MNILEQIQRIVGEYDHDTEPFFGDKVDCPNCGGHSHTCYSDTEDEDTGVHTWLFRCPDCGFEDYERY